MVEPLRHRQSKEAATDMFSLQPPRHISMLPFSTETAKADVCTCPLRTESDRLPTNRDVSLRANHPQHQ